MPGGCDSGVGLGGCDSGGGLAGCRLSGDASGGWDSGGGLGGCASGDGLGGCVSRDGLAGCDSGVLGPGALWPKVPALNAMPQTNRASALSLMRHLIERGPPPDCQKITDGDVRRRRYEGVAWLQAGVLHRNSCAGGKLRRSKLRRTWPKVRWRVGRARAVNW